LSRLAAVRRRALILVACGIVLAGCSGGKTVSPAPETVEGTLPKAPAVTGGDATAGKQVFAAQGCGSCHTYAPAGTNGAVGPKLDNLAADAQKAGQPVADYARTSITDPNGYVAPGFAQGIMPTTYGSLGDQKIADLVAFLTQKS
jgi:mono/diheme cytochrome c family protein